jgi:hypothetical protein
LGLHFGLPDDVYHADPALGSTGLKAVFNDPIQFQFDRLYPAEETESYEKTWGSAFHARTLEGREVFDAKYRVAPDPKTFKNLIVTDKDVKLWLAENGVSTRGTKTKADRVKLIREADATQPIWDVIKQQFEDSLTEGVTGITAKMAKEIQLAIEWMTRHQKLAGVMDDGAFYGGSPEVSLFYEHDGVRLKCRFDYVYPGLFVDLKSYRPWRPRETRKNVIKAIRDFRYDLQSAAYRKGFARARELYFAGQLAIHGEPPTDNFVDLLFQKDNIQWLWLMVKATGAPTSTLVEFPDELHVFEAAAREIEHAIHIYKSMVQQFGDDKDWMPEPDVLVLDDSDFPANFGIYS